MIRYEYDAAGRLIKQICEKTGSESARQQDGARQAAPKEEKKAQPKASKSSTRKQ